MNLTPKIGPLVAEILSGFTFILLGYFALHGPGIGPLKDSPALVAAALTLFAWILGTFFDAVRNLIVERILDWACKPALNWDYFFKGEKERLTNLDQYYFSFYLLDADVAIAIFLFLIAGPFVLSVVVKPVQRYSLAIQILLFVVGTIFAADAKSLRNDIKRFVSEKAKQD